MQFDENIIRSVVAQVLAEVGPMPGARVGTSKPVDAKSVPTGRYGIFLDADSAVSAARTAFEKYRDCSLADRKRVIDIIRRISIDQCEELGRMEMEETKIGRLKHKIEKLRTLGERTPGVEMLETKCYSGDHGLAVIERAPFGVIGAITPAMPSACSPAATRWLSTRIPRARKSRPKAYGVSTRRSHGRSASTI
jgi:aldehyde dehydrogenase